MKLQPNSWYDNVDHHEVIISLQFNGSWWLATLLQPICMSALVTLATTRLAFMRPSLSRVFIVIERGKGVSMLERLAAPAQGQPANGVMHTVGTHVDK